jgi:predicted  nucleic acid-binding Zn-ribbon protein
VTFKKPGEANVQPQLYVGIFECTNCNHKFRARVETASPTTAPAANNVAGLVERINTIREGLAQSLKTLQLKIKTLETERSSLLMEMEELKRTAEQRAAALETEVSQLREEIKSMREVLGSNVPATA